MTHEIGTKRSGQTRAGVTSLIGNIPRLYHFLGFYSLPFNSDQAMSKAPSLSVSPFNNLDSPPSVCLFFSFLISPNHGIFNSLFPQVPDRVVTDLRLADDANADAENSVTVTTPKDPYNFGHGLKSDAEISELRSRKRGKPLANYHKKQNAVCLSFSCFSFLLLTDIP